jgi:hypothetical protein
MYNRNDFKDIVNYFTKKYKLNVTGSYKRKNEYISDLDFLTYQPLNEVLDKINKDYNIEIISNGPLVRNK